MRGVGNNVRFAFCPGRSELSTLLELVPVFLHAGQATGIAGRRAGRLARGAADNVRFAPGKGLFIGQLLRGSVRCARNGKHRGERQQIHSRTTAEFEHDDLPDLSPKGGAKQALQPLCDLIAGNPDMIVFTQAKNPVGEAASFVKTSAAQDQAMTNDGHDRAPE